MNRAATDPQSLAPWLDAVERILFQGGDRALTVRPICALAGEIGGDTTPATAQGLVTRFGNRASLIDAAWARMADYAAETAKTVADLLAAGRADAAGAVLVVSMAARPAVWAAGALNRVPSGVDCPLAVADARARVAVAAARHLGLASSVAWMATIDGLVVAAVSGELTVDAAAEVAGAYGPTGGGVAA